jgi:hypothetical protein
MPTNIFAFTAPGSNFPAYISINAAQVGGFSVTVRSDGVTAEISLTREQAAEMAEALRKFSADHAA